MSDTSDPRHAERLERTRRESTKMDGQVEECFCQQLSPGSLRSGDICSACERRLKPEWAKPGLTYVQVRDAIIAEVGMMADARTPAMQAAYAAAVKRYAEGLAVLNIKVCNHCAFDPDPRGWSACSDCRALNHGIVVVEGAVTPAASTSTTVDDPVKPKHYQGDLVMRIIEHFGLHKDFYLGNVIKYLLRHKEKAGLTDLKKALWYLTRAIEEAEGKHKDGVK